MANYRYIEKLSREILYSEEEQQWIDTLINSDLEPTRIWSGEVNSIGVRRKDRDSIIKKIKKELEEIQEGYCYYCGFKFNFRVGERGVKNIHREHIAPKSLYKAFTFTSKNLVLACNICNGDDYKGDLNTISSLDSDYDNCNFNIIHPYLDNKSDHLSLEEDGTLANVNGSQKGKNTREMFGLDEIFHIENRRQYIICKSYNVGSIYELNLEELLLRNRAVF
ncbi:HNH endonuclease [Vibrio coralliirubri]|uniref:HNH endonuclease n=1 Tax=Vibrio coralliirubri TaxID=1516159 RepID=UPI00063A4D3B|nr:HNH endonuclease [Vibrio coralliirubri]CDT01831.1 conserved hypothetical protein [Vibrio coralliirubri]